MSSYEQRVADARWWRQIRDGVPDDIRGRLLVVDGQVLHTLKPE